MRRQLYGIISGTVYGTGMIICIIISIVPLVFKTESICFLMIDVSTTVIFLVDYIIRWLTADLDMPEQRMPFLRYPFRFLAVIDIISILPSVTMLNSGFRLLKLFRLMRTLRVVRAFKLFRYSRSIRRVGNVFRREKESLLTVLILASAYILISALVVFNVEPDTFDNFFEAIYWATVSLTTMGYGDIYPITAAGRVVTILSSLFGIAIVALPAGIVTAGYMEELQEEKKNAENESPDQ